MVPNSVHTSDIGGFLIVGAAAHDFDGYNYYNI
jgi:hypothetical protein